jgi:hypothetical protein
MSLRKVLAVLTAAAIAAGSVAATTGDAFAAAPATPHYKPLICIFIPLDICAPAKPKPHKVHNEKMEKKEPKPK